MPNQKTQHKLSAGSKILSHPDLWIELGLGGCTLKFKRRRHYKLRLGVAELGCTIFSWGTSIQVEGPQIDRELSNEELVPP